MTRLRVLHVSPFVHHGGSITAMFTLLREQSKRHDPVVFTYLEGDQTREARAIGIEAVAAFTNGSMPKSRWKKFPATLAALNRTVKEKRIDLIHSQSAIGNHYCWPASRMTGRALVTHQRDTYVNNYFHFGLGAAHAIIAVSGWVKSTMPARMRAKTTVVHDAVRAPAVAPPPQWSRADARDAAPVRVGFAGRAEPEKGLDLLIESALRLAPELDFDVEVWGFEDRGYNSEFVARVRRRVADAGEKIARRFRFEPYRSDMENFYAGVDVVVVPSRVREGFGLMAAEALGHQRACVAAAHGGLMEIVRSEETGLTFRPDDAGELTDQLRRVITDAALREKLAVAGRQHVMTHFSPDAHAKAVEAVYEKVLANRGA